MSVGHQKRKPTDFTCEADSVLRSIGIVKPLVDDPWQVQRSHGMIDYAIPCNKRGTMATILIPDARHPQQELAIWSLEGPRKREVILMHQLHQKDQKVTIMHIMNFEALDAFVLIQNPAVMHMLDTKDLRSLIDAPVSLHARHLVCLAQCVSRSEIIISSIDGAVKIYTLLMNKVLKTEDKASCVLREFNEYIVSCRLSWNLGGGLHHVRHFCIDEGWHNEGCRAMGIVDMAVWCWNWDTGALEFKITNSHLSMRQRVVCLEIRRDMPLLVAGFKDGRICVWSVRPGSQGKVVESLAGHQNRAIAGLKLDHRTGVLYSLDDEAMLKCWDIDRGVLVHEYELNPQIDQEEQQRDSQWATLEITRSPCRLALSYVQGRTVLIVRTPRHQEKVLQGQIHRRFFAKCESQIMWIKCLSSRKLMSCLQPAGRPTKASKRHHLNVPDRGADGYEIILVLCGDNLLHMYHAATCEVR